VDGGKKGSTKKTVTTGRGKAGQSHADNSEKWGGGPERKANGLLSPKRKVKVPSRGKESKSREWLCRRQEKGGLMPA